MIRATSEMYHRIATTSAGRALVRASSCRLWFRPLVNVLPVDACVRVVVCAADASPLSWTGVQDGVRTLVRVGDVPDVSVTVDSSVDNASNVVRFAETFVVIGTPVTSVCEGGNATVVVTGGVVALTPRLADAMDVMALTIAAGTASCVAATYVSSRSCSRRAGGRTPTTAMPHSTLATCGQCISHVCFTSNTHVSFTCSTPVYCTYIATVNVTCITHVRFIPCTRQRGNHITHSKSVQGAWIESFRLLVYSFTAVK